jgi:hypothetical protein
MALLKQNTARNRMIFMLLLSDHVTGVAGLTLTITASKDGAAFGSISPSVTDRGNGWYALALTSGDTDTLGDLALHITGGITAAPTDSCDQVVEDLPVPAGTIRAEIDSNSTQLAAIIAQTNLLPASPADVSDIPTAVENADALLKRDMSAVTGEAARSPLNALRWLRNAWAVAGGVLTVKKEDDVSTAWTSAIVTTAGDPVTSSDPA